MIRGPGRPSRAFHPSVFGRHELGGADDDLPLHVEIFIDQLEAHARTIAAPMWRRAGDAVGVSRGIGNRADLLTVPAVVDEVSTAGLIASKSLVKARRTALSPLRRDLRQHLQGTAIRKPNAALRPFAREPLLQTMPLNVR